MRPGDTRDSELPRLEGYRTISALGSGVRGEVFLARELATQDMVAVKVYHDDAAPAGIELAIAALAGCDAKLIARPRAFLRTAQGLPALVVSHAAGEPLSSALARGVRFTPRRSARIAEQIARALDEAARLIGPHSALHPGKIIVEGDAACLLGAGERLALPRRTSLSPAHLYAAPETLNGDGPSVASDVYSLGACLYHMLTGHPPSKAASLDELRAERRRGLAWPKGSSQVLPLELVALVDRCTSPDPPTRPSGGEPLAKAISAAVHAVSVRRPAAKPGAPVANELPSVEPDPPAQEHAASVFDRLSVNRTNALVAVSAAAVFALALAILLRPSGAVPVPHAPRPAASVPGTTAGAEVEPREPARQPEAPVKQPDERPVEPPLISELRRIEAGLSGNAAEFAALKRRLVELSDEDGEVGAGARRLLERIEELREERARELLERLLDKASVHRASGRLGDALQALASFPADLDDTAAAGRLRAEEEAIRAQGEATFARALGEARRLVADGRHAEARAVLGRIEQTMGLEPWVAKARGEIESVDRAEAETHAALERRRAEAESRAFREEALALLSRLPEMCRAFQYSGAETAIAAALLRPLEPDVRGRIDEYAELVRREAAQFRLAGERIRAKLSESEGEGKLVVPGTELELKIADIDERGLDLVGASGQGSMHTRLPWARLPEREAYKLMLHLGGNESVFSERLAIAVFAHHRGLRAETAVELTAAQALARRREEHEALRRITAVIYRVPDEIRDALRR